MHPDSNDEIEVVSDEMDVSNIDEDDQPSSRVEGNFSHDNQNTDPGLPYPPQNSPSAPLLGEITPHPEVILPWLHANCVFKNLCINLFGKYYPILVLIV